MNEYERENGMTDGGLDESLLSAMEEFEEIYGDDELQEQVTTPEVMSEAHMQDVRNPQELSSFQSTGNMERFPSEEILIEPVIRTRGKMSGDDNLFSEHHLLKRISWIPLACVILVFGIGVTCFIKRDDLKEVFSSKKETTEAMAEITTEEITTESTEENKDWIADTTLCVPEMTDDTISLPSADLSVFTTALQQEMDGVPAEERIDPWALVTLHLDSVDGSINKTSPGVLEETEQLTSTYMVLVDVDTNAIIAERDCEKVVPPASMTKILTVITAREYIDEENLDDKFIITADIVNEAQSSGLSAVGFLPGDEVTVRDMLYGTIVCSGADAAMGLAVYCAGSQEAFVEKMNENVEKMGLSDTAHFTNPVGKYDENLNCTMTDMATILSVAIQDELLLDVLSTRIYTTDVKYPELENMEDGITISNWFIRRIEDKETAGKVVAAKTGFVNQSGFCSASYYEADNGKRYICVTGNANSSWRAIYDHVGVYRSFTQ